MHLSVFSLLTFYISVHVNCFLKIWTGFWGGNAEIPYFLATQETIFLIYYLFFMLSTTPERLLFAFITTEITLSLLAVALSGTVTLIFPFINVPRKYLHFPSLSKFRALSCFNAESTLPFNTAVLHGHMFIVRVHLCIAIQENDFN